MGKFLHCSSSFGKRYFYRADQLSVPVLRSVDLVVRTLHLLFRCGFFYFLVPTAHLTACSAVSELEVLAWQGVCSLNSSTAAKSVFCLKQNNQRQSLRWKKLECHSEGLWTDSLCASSGWYCCQLASSFEQLFQLSSLVSLRSRT